MATPTLLGLKKFLEIEATDTTYDSELPTYLDSAEQTIAHRCGPIRPTAVTQQVRAHCGQFTVPQWPVISLTSVTDEDGTSVSVVGAKVDRGAGVIRLASGESGLLEVTYQAGYEPCPDDLELALYVVAGHLWDTQRGRSGGFSMIRGLDDDAPVGGDASYFVMQGFALPRRAMELTRPYIKAGFA